MPDMEPAGLNRFVHEVLMRFRGSGVAMTQPKLPEEKKMLPEEGQTQTEPGKVPWTARIPAFIKTVLGEVTTGPEIYPERGYYGLSEAIEPTQRFPGIAADEVIKHEVGTLLADANVEVQPKFLDTLKGVHVEAGLFGGAGGYHSEYGIGVSALEVGKVGYPGPEYETYPRGTGWMFLHEAIHRWDEILLQDAPKERKTIWNALLEHYDNIDPQSAKWLRWTAGGNNPVRAEPEAFNDALMHYLLHRRQAQSSELDRLLKDYFRFE